MKKQIVFDDEIILWWERESFPAQTAFACYLNGEKVAETNKTHLALSKLSADTEYDIKVVTGEGEAVFEGTLRTLTAKPTIDVTKAPYLAKGDGETLNTAALQKALDDCAENGRVYFPEGTYLTGALRVKSNTELFIAEGAVLQGRAVVEDYLPRIPSRFEGITMECYSSLINMGDMEPLGGCNCQNIVIRGGGKVVGGGRPLLDNIVAVERELLKEYVASLGEKIKDYETPDTVLARVRPRLINVSNTDGFIASNVSIEYGPAWNLHMVYSKDITVHNCTFKSTGVWNGDGIDPDSCEDVAIFGCKFQTGDDCIAIKSGKNPDGNIINRPCVNVYVFDCGGTGHGISIGSEMSGGIENVYIWDCDMTYMPYGLHIKATRKRGGYIKNIFVNNSTLPIFLVRSVSYNDDGEEATTPPQFSHFYVDNSVITGRDFNELDRKTYAMARRHIVIRGFGEDAKVREVYFRNVKIENPVLGDWLYVEDADGIHVN